MEGMNSHEMLLVALLREALVADLEAKMKEFESHYWALSDDAVPSDTYLGEAIHEFAQELEYFEPCSAWRTQAGLYDEIELRARIDRVLRAVPVRAVRDS